MASLCPHWGVITHCTKSRPPWNALDLYFLPNLTPFCFRHTHTLATAKVMGALWTNLFLLPMASRLQILLSVVPLPVWALAARPSLSVFKALLRCFLHTKAFLAK